MEEREIHTVLGDTYGPPSHKVLQDQQPTGTREATEMNKVVSSHWQTGEKI